jgi:hypothetical protein
LPNTSPAMLTVRQFCARTGISRATFNRHIDEIGPRRVGRRILIPVEAADRWCASLPVYTGPWRKAIAPDGSDVSAAR